MEMLERLKSRSGTRKLKPRRTIKNSLNTFLLQLKRKVQKNPLFRFSIILLQEESPTNGHKLKQESKLTSNGHSRRKKTLISTSNLPLLMLASPLMTPKNMSLNYTYMMKLFLKSPPTTSISTELKSILRKRILREIGLCWRKLTLLTRKS